MRTLLCIILLLVAASAGAQVYKWVDEKGVVHYTDQPPTKNAKPANLPKLQTYKQGALPSLENIGASNEQPQATTPPVVRIVSPAADETFRTPQPPVSVSVEVSPGLGDGQQLVYHVNGAAKTEPTLNTSYTVTGLERGSHAISVSVVNGAGLVIARSAPVSVHIKPPIAR